MQPRYNHDIRGNISERYLPLGELTQIQNDRHGQALTICNADGSSLTWERDYFGNIKTHKDLENRITSYEYDKKKQPTHQSIVNNKPWESAELDCKIIYANKLDPEHHYPLCTYEAKFLPCQSQDIYYQYEYGNLVEINDIGLNKKTAYQYDSENMRSNVDIFKPDQPLPLYSIKTSYDELRRESETVNYHMTNVLFPATYRSRTGYDAVGNKRHFQMDLDAPGYSADCRISRQRDFWSQYDTSDRVLVSHADIDGTIQASENKNQFSIEYENGFRKKEFKPFLTGKIVSSLEYDDEGKLVSTKSAAVQNKRGYHQDGWIQDVSEKDYRTESNTHLITNENGWRKQLVQS